MRWSTAEKVNAGFVIALGVVALIGVASITSIQRFAATTRAVNETHAALTELQSVLLSLSNAESAQRGYVIAPAYSSSRSSSDSRQHGRRARRRAARAWSRPRRARMKPSGA